MSHELPGTLDDAPRRIRGHAAITLLLCLASAWGGCGTDLEPIEARIVQSDVIPTVFTVTWDADPAAGDDAYVEIVRDGAVTTRAEATDNGDGTVTAVILGLKAGEDYDWTAVLVADGDTRRSETDTLSTGQVPQAFVDIGIDQSLLAAHPEASPDGFVVTSSVKAPSAALIIDGDGDYVWWFEHDEPDVAVTRALLSADRSTVWYTTYLPPDAAPDFEARSLVHRISIDGSFVGDMGVQGVHHDVAELPDGGLVTIAYDIRDIDGTLVIGDKVIEVAPDGSTTEITSAFDLFDVDLADVSPTGEWSHANAIVYDEEEDAVYVSFRTLNQIVGVRRSTGAVIRRIGGEGSDVTTGEGSSDLFENQHQFQLLDDGIVIFDNGSQEQLCSRGVEYRWNGDGTGAEVAWSYQMAPCSYTVILGDITRLRSGDTMVTWSAQGQIDRVTPEGDSVWRLNTDLGGALGFTTWIDALN